MESALWEAADVGPAGGGMHATDDWIDLGQRSHAPSGMSATTQTRRFVGARCRVMRLTDSIRAWAVG
jgi:hypothetical protein